MGAHAQLQSQVLPPPYDSVTECTLSPARSWEESVYFLRIEHVSEFVHRTGCLPWNCPALGTGEQALRIGHALQKPMLESGKGDTYFDKEESFRCC